MAHKKLGKIIIPFGVLPEKHELETASVFLRLGFDVEFIVPNRTKGAKTPDVKIDGILWEVKRPSGKSKKNIANSLRRAVKQSRNVIIDARDTKLTDNEVRRELSRNVPLTRSLAKLKLITKKGEVIEIK